MPTTAATLRLARAVDQLDDAERDAFEAEIAAAPGLLARTDLTELDVIELWLKANRYEGSAAAFLNAGIGTTAAIFARTAAELGAELDRRFSRVRFVGA